LFSGSQTGRLLITGCVEC